MESGQSNDREIAENVDNNSTSLLLIPQLFEGVKIEGDLKTLCIIETIQY